MVLGEQGAATNMTVGPVYLQPSIIGMHEEIRNRYREENIKMFHNMTFHTFP
jgi:hypothetical protein